MNEAPVTAAPAPPVELGLKGSLHRDSDQRERLAQRLYEALHPLMSALGVLFLVLVLAQRPAQEGTGVQRVLLAATWVLWLVFVAEYLLRLVIAPSTATFLRRTWWQLLLLAVPVLMLARSLLLIRLARPTRVALAALRGGRSAGATLTTRAGWLAVVTTIVVLAAADVLYSAADVRPYSHALHAAALGAITGEPTTTGNGLANLMDVVLALYAVVFFATSAGIVGAFLVENRGAGSPPAATGGRPSGTAPVSDAERGRVVDHPVDPLE